MLQTWTHFHLTLLVKYDPHLIQRDSVYLCPVYVAKHHHHTLCYKHQQENGSKLKRQQRHIVQRRRLFDTANSF